MKSVFTLIAVIFLVGGAAGADDASVKSEASAVADSGDGKTQTFNLQYRFREGDIVNFHARAESTMRVSAREVTQTLVESREEYKHFRVVEVAKDGSALIEPVIDRAIMKARSDDNPQVVWDSRAKGAPPKKFEHVAKTVGKASVRVRYGTSGEVDEVVPLQKDDEAATRDKSDYGFLIRLPDDAVAVGDTWSDDFAVTVTPDPEFSRKLKKDVDIRRIYTLREVSDGVAEISFLTFVKKRVRDPLIEAQLISRSLAGSVRFDIERGVILQWTSQGSGNVFSLYGPGSSLESSLRSVEKFVSESRANLKPVASSSPQGAAAEPGRKVTTTQGAVLPPGSPKL